MKRKNARQTRKSPLTEKQRKLIKGRPLGTKKAQLFEETRLGHILKYEAQEEYKIILQATSEKYGKPPLYELVLAVTKSSSNPVFSFKRFATALEDYRVNGLYTRYKAPPTPEQLRIYAERRKKKLAEIVWANRFIIRSLSK